MANLKEETYEEKANRQLAILGVKSHEELVPKKKRLTDRQVYWGYVNS